MEKEGRRESETLQLLSRVRTLLYIIKREERREERSSKKDGESKGREERISGCIRPRGAWAGWQWR